jgi:hypothetical protein
MYPPPTLNDACFVLQQLDSIPRPDGDNEGDAINSDSVYYALEPHHQQIVDHAYTVVCAYTREPGGMEANTRAVNALTRRGYPTYLGPDQYDAYRLVGTAETENWCLIISDPDSSNADDDY